MLINNQTMAILKLSFRKSNYYVILLRSILVTITANLIFPTNIHEYLFSNLFWIFMNVQKNLGNQYHRT